MPLWLEEDEPAAAGAGALFAVPAIVAGEGAALRLLYDAS